MPSGCSDANKILLSTLSISLVEIKDSLCNSHT